MSRSTDCCSSASKPSLCPTPRHATSSTPSHGNCEATRDDRLLLGVEIAFDPGDLVHLRETDAPGTVVTTTRTKWDAFTQGVRAGEFDHFAEPDHPEPRSPHPVTAPGEHPPVRESDDDLSP
ncbi:DUF397 domain-containing protein [Streptomyces sp. BpilaLS-43]|uniref:DUF397 domain-containing protein n=1 Tax=Streptomyces sp. BpilaLS-43 TaxID=1839778 RepID=UPI00159EF665